jgi:hypothetical protein
MLSGASTVDANRGQPDRTVPIHGVLSGTDNAVPIDSTDRCYGLQNDDGFYQLHYTGTATGVASHLGRVDYTVDHCTWVNDPLEPTGGSYGDGSVTIAAANGDKLVVDHSGTFEFKDGFSYVVQVWTINGTESTGRFHGATGSGTGDLIGNLTDSTISATWSGVIAYDASNR